MAWRADLSSQIRNEYNLLFTSASLKFRGNTLLLANAMIDTGSTSTILAAETVEAIGIVPELDDILRTLRGVGGFESVYTKRVERLELGGLRVDNFDVEVGEMDYGVPMDAIIGLDFLRQTGARIDLEAMTIRHRRRTRI